MVESWRKQPFSLESQSWRQFSLEGKDCLIKGLFKDTEYHVMLSDQSSIWEEILNSEEILQRSKLLNPHVEAPLSTLLKNLSLNITSLQSGCSFSSSATSHPQGITLGLSTTLASLPFKWEFTLREAPLDAMSVHLVTPLLSMVSELCHRQQELVKLLAKKDRQIQDYKDHGAEVSRKHLETGCFEVKVFSNQMTSSLDFVKRSQHPLAVFMDQTSQELYQDVSAAALWAKKSNGSPPMESDVVAPTTLPSPVKSPLKTTPVVNSPSKQDEFARRKALEKKLEDDKQKPKRKKKKLM